MAAGSTTPAFRSGGQSGLNDTLLVQCKSLPQKKWWQPFEKTTNIDNCCLPHIETHKRCHWHTDMCTQLHTLIHIQVGGGEGEKINMKAKKKGEGGGEKGEEIITYKDQGKAEGCEGPPSGNVRDTLKL